MSATVDATFLTGQVGGSMPTSNIGPWANGSEWWFWDAGTGQYQPSDQGSPVGTVVMWGGSGVPTNWLLCDGRSVSRNDYSRLYQAIGNTWGGSDANGTFNLPPGGRVPIGAPQYITYDDFNGAASAPNNIPPGTLGGSGLVTLGVTMMPPMFVWVYYQEFSCAAGSDHQVSDIRPLGQPGLVQGQHYPVVDGNVPTGSNQTSVFTMPPFASFNFIIKYQ
jgi:hypothetical protein